MAGPGEAVALAAAYKSGMLLPRLQALLYDPFLALGERRGLAAHRRALLAGAHGRVLELGAGTGLNLAHYPVVDELVLTEPVGPMRDRLRRRVRRSAREARVVEAAAERLPFADGSFDVIVCTLVLCTVDNPAAVLAEARRVLAPDGRLLFIEHVRSGAAPLAAWQDRLAKPWRWFAAGCRCNQPTLDLLGHAGFRVGSMRSERWRGMPAIVRPLTIGEASR